MYLAFDVGGTFIKYAIIDGEKIVEKSKVETPSGEKIVDLLASIYFDFKDKYEIEGLAVSSAGQVNIKDGSMFASTNIPNYEGVQVRGELSSKTNLPVEVENDVTSCLYNYNDEKLLYIAVGTGVGGAYREKDILRGENFAEMEVGTMWLNRENTFEELCSTNALLKRYENKTNEKITGEQLNKLFLAGDENAKLSIDEYFDDFAYAVDNLVYIFDPKYIILGGGVTEAELFDIDKLTDKIKKISREFAKRNVSIQKSKLGNDAALIGVCKKAKLNR